MKCPGCDDDEHPASRAHWFKPVTAKVTPAPRIVTNPVTKQTVTKQVTRAPCPTCGHMPPMTPAQKMRAYRARHA